MPRQPLGRRINAWLAEAPGETFRDGKWRFWLITVIGLSVLNSILTALVFQNDDQENYMAAIVLSAGALVAWICVGAIHYSDNDDRKLSVGVSALDSVALVFDAAHFCGLLWVYGHMRMLRGADARYEAAAAKFNAEARQVQDGNVKIAEAAQAIAQENTRAERLHNDTAYQQRRTVEGGGIIRSSRRTTQSATLAPALSTSASLKM